MKEDDGFPVVVVLQTSGSFVVPPRNHLVMDNATNQLVIDDVTGQLTLG